MKASWIILLVSGLLQTATDAAIIRLQAVPATVRVRQEGAFRGAEIAEISAARGEVESFQVIVTASDGNLRNTSAEMSPLKGRAEGSIPAANITLYREVFIPVRCSSPQATEPPGLIADPLIPFVNPYTNHRVPEPRWRDKGLEGARFGAVGFDLWQGQHQPLWVDMEIPKDAAPGVYEGTLRVRAQEAQPATIPVRLTVWDFTLPDGPTHENHFGNFSYMARYHKLQESSEKYQLLEDRYLAMMAAHRLNPPLPRRLHPKIAEDGTALFDDDTDRQITAFVERYHVTNIDVPRAPFRDMLTTGRAQAIRYYQSWYAYLQKKGWAARAYLYMLDEPNTREAYEQVRQLGALVREAAPGLRRLVVEQPYSQDPNWGSIDTAVDIWCPLFAFVEEGSVKRAQAAGDAVWSYTALVQRAPSYHPDSAKVRGEHPPYWQIDFPVLSYRIAPWLNRRYGVTGLLYWTTVCWTSPQRNPWDNPGFRVNFNGEGMLFYPGEDAGIEGPVATIRLKNLRDGLEDYEYFTLLEKRKGKEAVDEIVRAAVPTWGMWNQDPYHLLGLRERMAHEIMR
ncbi:MAG: DUF4091 domain-containing protein [Planctomycetes bacterium]|jgi:hypothetical protein|nr:DUF4091 domain-containing protein [Planctomycetota bacterium]